jgi:hypothetical protein
VIITVGTVGFMITEGLSLSDALYFSIVTVTTVGYGDISPVSSSGKILSILLIITGVGTFLGVVANATEMLLQRHERKVRMEKLNMVISAFFSELGTRLMTLFVESDPAIHQLGSALVVSNNWSDKHFASARTEVKGYPFSMDMHTIDLEALRTLLSEKGTKKLPDSDLGHLSGDIKRAYSLLVLQWLDYMKYLKENYPYLFSLAVRTNPFDKTRSPVVKE